MLKDIKGQDTAVEFFRSSVNRKRLAHACLFLGLEGLGKTLLAKNLAKFLNCDNPVKEEDVFIDCCDTCITCHKIDDFNHPDVHWVESGRSKKISIDDIRLAQKEISLKPYEAKFKIFIILQAEDLTEEAQNSLLKTLEEPPAFSLIILTAANISGLLPTIISRCQIIKFYPFNYERLKETLVVDYKLKANDAQILAAQAEGRIGLALSLREKDALSKKNLLIDRVCQPGRRFYSADIFNIKDKKELSSQMRYLLNWFRDILIFKVGLATANIINADRPEAIKSWAKVLSLEDLEQLLTRIEKTKKVIELNVNPKIALEVMMGEINKAATYGTK